MIKEANQLIADHMFDFDQAKFNQQIKQKEFVKAIAYYGPQIINDIYFYGDLNFAEALINAGVEFNPGSMARGILNKNSTEYTQYLHNIKDVIHEADYEIARELVSSMFSQSSVVAPYNCFDPVQIIFDKALVSSSTKKETIKNIIGEIYAQNNTYVNDILTTTAIRLIQPPLMNPVNVVFSASESYSSIKMSSCTDIDNDKSTDVCILPADTNDKVIKARIVHELGHFAFEVLFHNNMNPYATESEKIAYYSMGKNFLHSVLSNIGLGFNISYLENQEVSLTNVRNGLLSKCPDIMLYTVESRLDDPTRINLLSRQFFDIALNSVSERKFMESLYRAEIAEKSVNPSLALVLERIGDWVTYHPDELDKELLPRLPELLLALEDKEVSYTILEPLEEFWSSIIHPKVQELRGTINLLDCTDHSEFIVSPSGEIEL